MFKPKSPIGKENTRIGTYFNDTSKTVLSPYPNPHSPFSHNLNKTKSQKEQQHYEYHHQPNFTRNNTNDLSLECDEILEEIHQQYKKEGKIQNIEDTLMCEQSLDNVKVNDWKTLMISRMQKILRSYQERNEVLERENAYLKEQLHRQRPIHYYHKK